MKKKVINLFGNSETVPNKGVKYSKLLEKFMNPFVNDFSEYEYIEDIFEFSINAWNTANMNIILPNADIDEIIDPTQQNKEDVLLLKRMVAHKHEKFKSHTNFIVDFELKEGKEGEDPILSVTTQEEDAYISDMLNAIEERKQLGQENYEENFVNRSAFIIKPKQPFIDWHNDLYPTSKIDDIEVDIYLVDDTITDLEKFLKKKFDRLFTQVLYDWHTNKKEWPQRRNYKMFKEWFRVEVSETVFDLERKPVLKSE